jgi:hypothetical protein
MLANANNFLNIKPASEMQEEKYDLINCRRRVQNTERSCDCKQQILAASLLLAKAIYAEMKRCASHPPMRSAQTLEI